MSNLVHYNYTDIERLGDGRNANGEHYVLTYHTGGLFYHPQSHHILYGIYRLQYNRSVARISRIPFVFYYFYSHQYGTINYRCCNHGRYHRSAIDIVIVHVYGSIVPFFLVPFASGE